MVSFPSNLTPTKRVVLIAIIVGVIAGFGALLFFEGLKWGTVFFMGYLLQYAYPHEGQTVAAICQWTEPHSLVLLLPEAPGPERPDFLSGYDPVLRAIVKIPAVLTAPPLSRSSVRE